MVGSGDAAGVAVVARGQDVRKVLIATIHKFGEAGGKLNERSNIIVMVDEAHRDRAGEGSGSRAVARCARRCRMRSCFRSYRRTRLIGPTRMTFWAFGADEDNHGYMSRDSFQESIRDKATLPLHF